MYIAPLWYLPTNGWARPRGSGKEPWLQLTKVCAVRGSSSIGDLSDSKATGQWAGLLRSSWLASSPLAVPGGVGQVFPNARNTHILLNGSAPVGGGEQARLRDWGAALWYSTKTHHWETLGMGV